MELINKEEIVIAGDIKVIDNEMYIKIDDVDDCLEKTRIVEPKQDWIPCNERLPEPYETVLATGKMKEDKESLVYMGCVNGKKEWQLLGVRNCMDYIILAWQPLPEAYQTTTKLSKPQFSQGE